MSPLEIFLLGVVAGFIISATILAPRASRY